jgi:hypothetical protein
MQMAWLVGLFGIILLGVGLYLRSRGGRNAEPVDDRGVDQAEAWKILTSPIVREAPADAEKKQGLLSGLLVGLGVGAILVGLFLLLLPAEAPSPQPPLPGVPSPPAAQAPPAPTPTEVPPPTPKPINQTFVIDTGDMAPTIAAKLKEAGLIADEQAFLTRVTEREVDTRLKAGTFIIPTDAPLDKVIDVLTA